ncbi:MAG TPA: N-acetylneuraminate synthase family protein [Candidatus Lokiarchaeia archaeon]
MNETSRPFIVAEAGVNYYDIAKKEKITILEAAKKMIKEAAKSGADAVKFQSYKAEKLASKYSPAYWDTTQEKTKSQYELFKNFDKFDKNDFKELSSYSKKNNICFLSTPFDFEAIDYLEKLMPVYKIASADITNAPFIRYIASKKKPIFLSTGASTIKEIKDAIKIINSEGNNEIVIMHCILNYPTKYENANLGMIKYLKEKFPNYLIGYSDHTLPDYNMLVLSTAYLFGAVILEKHFTLDKTLPGNDHYHAMDQKDLAKLCKNIDLITKTYGITEKKPIKSEEISRKYARRSIVAAQNISKNSVIEENMITFKRPGTGVSPVFYKKVIGKKAKRDIKDDEILEWKDFC